MVETIDGTVAMLREQWPILSDTNFQREFPGIEHVASFLHTVINGPQKSIPAFERAGITDLSDYFQKLQSKDPAAKQIYRSVKNSLQF